jgi:hypothetical protein
MIILNVDNHLNTRAMITAFLRVIPFYASVNGMFFTSWVEPAFFPLKSPITVI